jgi:hypothetical protein
LHPAQDFAYLIHNDFAPVPDILTGLDRITAATFSRWLTKFDCPVVSNCW